MKELNVMIVEDETTAGEYLKSLIQRHFPQMNLVAYADSAPQATELILTKIPDIVFMDIDIKQGTAFDVLGNLPEIKPEIIFTTAFNQFAIDAFKFHAVDYLLKPLEESRFITAVSHCISQLEHKNNSKQVARLLAQMQQPVQQHISISTIESIEFISLEDVLFAEAKGNYTELKLTTGRKITASKKLKDIEQTLSEPAFFRIHNSYIINSKHVRKYFKGRGGYVTLTDDSSLPVSAARKEDFLKRFE